MNNFKTNYGKMNEAMLNFLIKHDKKVKIFGIIYKFLFY